MKSEKLLYAFGQIDERYIVEAAPKTVKIESRKHDMKKNNTIIIFRRPAVAAVLMMCICLSGVTAMAAAGSVQGFFKDILNGSGAVAGSRYEQATDELELAVRAEEGQLRLRMVMVYPDRMPYSEFETLGIGHYQILDEDQHVIAEGRTEMAAVSDGQAAVSVSLDGLPAGSYLLRVTEMTGGKKADQPLGLHGTWECGFRK